MDNRTTADLLQIVNRWHAENRTIIAVLHNYEQVRSYFPRTLLLAREPIAWGDTAAVLNPENLQRAQLMSEAGTKPRQAVFWGGMLSHLWAIFLAPFQDFIFMRHALVACLALALGCGPIGVLLVLRRMSLVGDALSHAVLPGVALGFLVSGLSLYSMTLGGIVAGLAVALLSGAVSRVTLLREDAEFCGPVPGFPGLGGSADFLAWQQYGSDSRAFWHHSGGG